MSNSSKYRFLSLAVIAVMSIALAACGGDNGNNTTTGGGSTSGGGGSSMSNADLIKTAATNMKNAKSYHIDVNATAAGQNVTMNGDIDIANKNLNMTASVAGTNVQIVVVGSDAYLSTDGGKNFTKTDSSTASSMTSGFGSFTQMWSSFNGSDIDAAASSLKDGSPANETIDGVNTKHIIADASALKSLSSNLGGSSDTPTAISSTTGTVDMWVATDASSVKQLKENITSGGQQVQATIKWSNLNNIPAITAPANATGSGSGGSGNAPAAVPTTDTSGGSGGSTDMSPTPGQ